MTIEIVPATDDAVLAAHYHRHWLELGTAESEVAPEWRDRFSTFVRAAREERAFAAFVARAPDATLGSACCHRVDRVYPAFRADDPGASGYVWGVYVEPSARGQGLGRLLVQACLQHLQRQGCGRVLLHTGVRARPLYDRMGFTPTDEMALRLHP